jgi:hypothetical protein
MTAETKQQTITPERQMLAAQVGTVFNAAHEYLRNLEPTGDDGSPIATKQLEFAHCRIDEAAMWAIKSVLAFGGPKPKPSPAEHVASANEGPVEAASLTPENTSMPDVPDPLPAEPIAATADVLDTHTS